LTLKLFYNQENLSQYKKNSAVYYRKPCGGFFPAGLFPCGWGTKKKKTENSLQVKKLFVIL